MTLVCVYVCVCVCSQVYAFSQENWKRSEQEVDFILRTIGDLLDAEMDALNEKVRTAGDLQDADMNDQSKNPLPVHQGCLLDAGMEAFNKKVCTEGAC